MSGTGGGSGSVGNRNPICELGVETVAQGRGIGAKENRDRPGAGKIRSSPAGDGDGWLGYGITNSIPTGLNKATIYIIQFIYQFIL